MVRRLLLIVSLVLVFGYFVSVSGESFPRGVVSASYCYGFDNYNYMDLSTNYYVYYLTFAGYPISYLDVFGGVSYKFDNTATDTQFGFTIGASWLIIFVDVHPTYRTTSYLLYRDYSTCYAYGGMNYPLWWEGGGQTSAR